MQYVREKNKVHKTTLIDNKKGYPLTMNKIVICLSWNSVLYLPERIIYQWQKSE